MERSLCLRIYTETDGICCSRFSGARMLDRSRLGGSAWSSLANSLAGYQPGSMREILGGVFAAKDHDAVEHLVPPRRGEVRTQRPSRNGSALAKFAPGQVNNIAVNVCDQSAF